MDDAMIERLKYVSRAARPMTSTEIIALTESAAKNNASTGLTGVLLSVEGVFMQILEGPASSLAPVFDRIERDARHRDLVVIRRTTVDSRLFGGWSMRLLAPDPVARQELLPVLELIQACARGSNHAGNKLHALDDALWRAIGNQMAPANAAARASRSG